LLFLQWMYNTWRYGKCYKWHPPPRDSGQVSHPKLFYVRDFPFPAQCKQPSGGNEQELFAHRVFATVGKTVVCVCRYANSCSSNQEFPSPRILWNPKLRYRFNIPRQVWDVLWHIVNKLPFLVRSYLPRQTSQARNCQQLPTVSAGRLQDTLNKAETQTNPLCSATASSRWVSCAKFHICRNKTVGIPQSVKWRTKRLWNPGSIPGSGADFFPLRCP
jgi:hypothetical protein